MAAAEPKFNVGDVVIYRGEMWSIDHIILGDVILYGLWNTDGSLDHPVPETLLQSADS